ncbi:MAG: hypothetical protein ACRDL6_00925 [Solirubrobacterales bacterium]
MAQRPGSDKGRPSEALRAAIERTFEATAGPAAEARTRAGELLDEVARRGRQARDRIEKLEAAVRDEVERRKP